MQSYIKSINPERISLQCSCNSRPLKNTLLSDQNQEFIFLVSHLLHMRQYHPTTNTRWIEFHDGLVSMSLRYFPLHFPSALCVEYFNPSLPLLIQSKVFLLCCLFRPTAGDWLWYGKHLIVFMGVCRSRCEMVKAQMKGKVPVWADKVEDREGGKTVTPVCVSVSCVCVYLI